jgi:hypothetical protein
MTTNAHKEVIGLDIAMNEVFRVDVFDSTNHLICQHQHRFHSETARAEIEQILQRWTQKIHHQNIVISLLTVPSVRPQND